MKGGPKRSAGVCTYYSDYDLIDTRAAQAQRGRFKEPEKLGLHIARTGEYLGNQSDGFREPFTSNELTQNANGKRGRNHPDGPDIPHPELKRRAPRPY